MEEGLKRLQREWPSQECALLNEEGLDLGSWEHWVSHGLYYLDLSFVSSGAESICVVMGRKADGTGKPCHWGGDVSWAHDYPVNGKGGAFFLMALEGRFLNGHLVSARHLSDRKRQRGQGGILRRSIKACSVSPC